MPLPKLLKKILSKRKASESSPSPDVPAGDEKDTPSQTDTATADGPVPEYSDSLTEAWAVAHQELPLAQGGEKFLNKIGDVQDSLTLSPGQQAVADTLVTPAKALMDKPQIVGHIKNGVDAFIEAVPVLMKALDEVAKVHPFISVVVLAFKAVYTLEAKRRENDKRVLALYVEMKDMVAVLVQLKDVSDPKQAAPDGQTIEGRMQKLCEAVADDIKNCANACDTYLKKKLLVKIFAGPIWEERLLEFVDVFTKRREEFELALAIHAAVGLGAANLKLDTVDERTAELARKIGIMLELFQEFVTPEQKKLAAMVEQRGGNVAALKNEQAMRELVDAELSLTAPPGSDCQRGGDRPSDIVELQQEINSDPNEAIEKNAEIFNRKFDIQRRQIVEDLSRVINREGDRIISAVTTGPHERIIDPDLYLIWKDMGWRGDVKARHFVLALKDHYTEMVAGSSGGVAGSDRWALEFIGINYVRSILEAFDEDGSGFITVKEANNFTRSRPLDWSLPHWLAYWAIGWQMTCTNYCEKIEEIFDAMIRLSDEVLPENRREVNRYFGDVWEEVTIFARSIKWEKGTESLRAKFQSHVTAEEARLQKNLEDIKYDIDGRDSVRLISEHVRIETTLFPMLYLVLKTDLQKISLARKHVLSNSELPDAAETIRWITLAARDRTTDLRAIFEQQNLSPKEQFAIFAKGLYNICSEGNGFHGDKLRELPDPIPARSEVIPDPDSILLNVLNHPIGNEHEVDFAAYDSPTPTVSLFADGPDAILGMYYGFIYLDGVPLGPMIKWTLHRGGGVDSIVASGTHYHSGFHKTYTLTGTTGALEGGKMRVDLKIVYTVMWMGVSMTGYFDPEENSLKGTTAMADGTSGEFVFKRDPDLVRLYPAPSTIDARARWNFATTVILDRIRRQSWSPSYILKRIKDGKRYMHLSRRECYYGKRLGDDELKEYNDLLSSLYEADARFYASLINIELSKVSVHSIGCDSCDAILGGARVLCMDCHDKTTLDLCSEPECLDSVITLEYRPDLKTPHTPNHNMLKVHRILFGRDTARTERNAKDALGAARQTLSDLKAKKQPTPDCVRCQNVVSLPCWYCVDCTEGRFICVVCEYKCLAFNDTHTKSHTLVRVTQKVEGSNVPAEERLKSVEGQLESVKGQLDSVKGQLGSVQDELSKMRQLLSKLFEKGAEGSLSDPLTKGDILDAAKAEPGLGGPPIKVESGEGQEGTGDKDEGGDGEDEDRD